MRRLNLEATDENVLKSIKENTFNRNADVKDFIEALESIEGNMFISLDAPWGEGKTFYVRQIEKTLEFVTKRIWAKDEEKEIKEVENLKHYFKGTSLDSLSLKKSYLPIYYNAWLYDNHNDPLMSLLFTIVKKTEQYIDCKIEQAMKDKLLNAISSLNVSLNLGLLQIEANGECIKDLLTIEDILEEIRTAEEIRQLVKSALDSVKIEKAERLVIFLDELDRCRPTYAIEMLERIKHYFDDERIIFVVSVNKEQLIHTISKYYGMGFDATSYLNKFFDFNAHMPIINDGQEKNLLLEQYPRDNAFMVSIATGLAEYYKLTLREVILYKQRISEISSPLIGMDTLQECCVSLFVPLILILDIKNVQAKSDFLNGTSNIINLLYNKVPEVNLIISKFNENSIEVGKEKFDLVYKYTFSSIEVRNYYDSQSYRRILQGIDMNLKRKCIMICNSLQR